MMKIKKGITLFLIAAFLLQDVAFCAQDNCFALRAPTMGNYERITAVQIHAKKRIRTYLTTAMMASILFAGGYSLYVYQQAKNNPTFSSFFTKVSSQMSAAERATIDLRSITRGQNY